jgi:hypothetical protein
LELSFENPKLRKICEDKKVALERYGPLIANVLQTHLADIRAAHTISETLEDFYKIGETSEKDSKALSYDLYEFDMESIYGLQFRIGHTKIPVDPSGEPQWDKISRMKILDIAKHDE